MDYKIEHDPVFTILKVKLEKGESYRAEAGAMMSMSPSIQLEAKTTGKGLFGTIKAAVGGEGFFASLFTAVDAPGEVILGPAAPGDILKMELNNQTIYAQAGAYLAGSPNLELSAKGSAKALFSGEGLFLSKISGTGTVFISSYGAIFIKELAPGEKYIVDTGHIVAFEESVNYTIKKAAKGLFSTVASGEGLVCEYVGPGKLWIQTRNVGALAKLLIPFLPKS